MAFEWRKVVMHATEQSSLPAAAAALQDAASFRRRLSEVRQGLLHMVDGARAAYPRLCFVPDEDVLAGLLAQRHPSAVPPSVLGGLFSGLSSLVCYHKRMTKGPEDGLGPATGRSSTAGGAATTQRSHGGGGGALTAQSTQRSTAAGNAPEPSTGGAAAPLLAAASQRSALTAYSGHFTTERSSRGGAGHGRADLKVYSIGELFSTPLTSPLTSPLLHVSHMFYFPSCTSLSRLCDQPAYATFLILLSTAVLVNLPY